MGELKKLTPQELAELRVQLKMEQSSLTGEEEQEVLEETAKKITVKVARDKMTATIMLHEPEDETYSKDEIIEALQKNNVTTGYIEDALKKLIKGELYDEDVLVAQGTPPVQGKDGYFEFFFSTISRKQPLIREDGTADYSAMGRLETVQEGDVIAKYHPSVQGEKGVTVTGADLMPRYVRELPVLRGKSIARNDDTNEYTATASGKISYINGNIEIHVVHEVNTDVDMTTGNIDFYGDIIITGNVEAGVTIRSGRNITVEGTVSAAKLYAAGDIVLQRGIQGGGKGKVSARGNVFADFIEYAEITAAGDINANSIIGSQIDASGHVLLQGKRGSVMGGVTHGLKGITLKTAGNLSEVKTTLHAGFKEEDYQKTADLIREEKELTQTVNQLVKKMTAILQQRKKSNTGFNKKQKAILLELNDKKEEYYKRIDEIGKDKQELATKMALGRTASIIIKGDIFRGTTVSIDVASLNVMKQESFVRYICKNDKIERRTVPR